MRLLTLLTVVVGTLALLPASLAAAQPLDGATTAAKKQATKGKAKAKRKSCRKGYALKTVKVKRKGKIARVKRCRKKKAVKRAPVAAPKAPSSPAPAPSLPPGAPKPLFDPPGSTLEGEAAKAWIERYLHDSRFTDCPAGLPSCGSERRYSHFANTFFYRCLLSPIAGLGISFSSAFFYEAGTVRPDGSWSFNETVIDGGRPSFYDWSVAVDGTVTGTYNFPRPLNPGPEAIGPLRYAAGARDCSS